MFADLKYARTVIERRAVSAAEIPAQNYLVDQAWDNGHRVDELRVTNLKRHLGLPRDLNHASAGLRDMSE